MTLIDGSSWCVFQRKTNNLAPDIKNKMLIVYVSFAWCLCTQDCLIDNHLTDVSNPLRDLISRPRLKRKKEYCNFLHITEENFKIWEITASVESYTSLIVASIAATVVANIFSILSHLKFTFSWCCVLISLKRWAIACICFSFF